MKLNVQAAYHASYVVGFQKVSMAKMIPEFRTNLHICASTYAAHTQIHRHTHTHRGGKGEREKEREKYIHKPHKAISENDATCLKNY